MRRDIFLYDAGGLIEGGDSSSDHFFDFESGPKTPEDMENINREIQNNLSQISQDDFWRLVDRISDKSLIIDVLEQDTVNLILEKGLEFSINISNVDALGTTQSIQTLDEAGFNRLAVLFAGANTEDKDGSNISDKAFKSALELNPKLKAYGLRLAEKLAEETNISPNVMAEQLMSALENPNFGILERGELSSIFEHAVLKDDRYLDEIEKYIVADEQSKFARTGYALDLIRNARGILKYARGEEDKSKNIRDVIDGFIVHCKKMSEGSYFLVKKAERILDEIDGKARQEMPDFGVFKISPSMYAAQMLDGLAVSSDPKPLVLRDANVTHVNDSMLRNVQTAEVTQGDVADFVYMQEKFMRQMFLAEFGIPLNSLTLPEQFQLLSFLKSKTENELEKAKVFTKDFGVEGLRLFMLRDVAGKDFGDELVSVVERVGDENAQAIVSKCAQILEEINYFDEIVNRPDSKKDVSKASNPEVVNKVRTKILNKVFSLFSSFKDKDGADRLIKNLENISSEAVLMQSMVTATRESGGVALNDLPDIDLHTGEGYTITLEQAARIKEIYASNYETRPKMLEKLLADLDVSIGEENTEFHTLYFKGELVGVVVFEYNGEQVYFGKFNIDPKFQGGQIGEQLMTETLDRISKNHIVSATCSKGAPVTPKYIERGFVAEGEFAFEEDECLNIIRNDSMNDLFKSKSMDEEFILDHASLNGWEEFENGHCKVLMTDYNNMNHLRLPMLADDKGEYKWVMTRFFKRRSTGNENFAVVVLEKLKRKDFEEFKTKVKPGNVLEKGNAIIL